MPRRPQHLDTETKAGLGSYAINGKPSRDGSERTRLKGISDRIGAQLKAYRNQGGMTQAALAKAVGVSQQQIQKYESGQDRLPADKLHVICAALGVRASDIFRAFDNVPVDQARLADSRAAFSVDAYDASEVAQLAHAFQQIRDALVRKRLLDLVRALGR